LWVCSNNFDKKGEVTSVKAFDLRSGEVKGSYPLPGQDPLCNLTYAQSYPREQPADLI
jgi:hypothetical protein